MTKLAQARSFGGGNLVGTKIVRVVYLDEAGRGNINDEPLFVVAAAITHPDTQWHNIRRYYTDLANDVLNLKGNDAYGSYIFHAKDVWHGHGDFPRARFSLKDRMSILARLAQVPKLFDVPVCIGLMDRKAIAEELSTAKASRHIEHAQSYIMALQYVDTWMNRYCPGEVAMVTAEDTDEVKETIRMFHGGLQKLDEDDEYFDRGHFVTKSIVDSVNFASKESSPVLQLADHCAFLAKRTATGCPHAKKIWQPIAEKVWFSNKHDGAKVRMLVHESQLRRAD